MTRDVETGAPVVLVTGGAGFIGTALAQRLVPTGFRVVAVDSLLEQVHPGGTRPSSLPESVDLVVADVTQTETWDQILGDRGLRPDMIVHLAAETGTGQSLTEASRHATVNVVGTTQMTDALIRHDAAPRHLLLASSRAVYGEGRWASASGATFYPAPRSHAQLDDAQWDCLSPDGTIAHSRQHRASETVPAPTSVYGATKLAQEHVLLAWCLATGTDLSVLRLQNVYGPGQSLTNSYTGIVTLFSRLAAAGQQIPLYEDGEVQRDFVYIDDVVTALVLALKDAPIGGHRVLDVGSGVSTTIADLAREVSRRHPGAPEPRVTGQFRDGDVRHASCDITDTANELRWKPEWSLAEGLAALDAWMAGSS